MLKLIKSAIQRTIWQNRSERGLSYLMSLPNNWRICQCDWKVLLLPGYPETEWSYQNHTAIHQPVTPEFPHRPVFGEHTSHLQPEMKI